MVFIDGQFTTYRSDVGDSRSYNVVDVCDAHEELMVVQDDESSGKTVTSLEVQSIEAAVGARGEVELARGHFLIRIACYKSWSAMLYW